MNQYQITDKNSEIAIFIKNELKQMIASNSLTE